MATLSIAYFDGAQTTTATRDLSGKGTSHAFLVGHRLPAAVLRAVRPAGGPVDVRVRRARRRLDDDAHVLLHQHGRGARHRPERRLAARRRSRTRAAATPAPAAPASATLAAGDDCTVVVAFTPGGTVVEHRDAVDRLRRRHRARDRLRPLSGSGTTGPLLVVQDFDVTNLMPAAWDFGTRGVDQADDARVLRRQHRRRARERADRARDRRRVRLRGRQLPRQGGSCSTALAAGRSCIVNVEFQPAAPGLATGNVRINYQDASGTPLLGGAASCAASARTVGLLEIDEKSDHNEGLVTDFGTVGLGSSGERMFTVRNVGGGPVSAMSFATPRRAVLVRGRIVPRHERRLRHALAAGGTCTVDVAFTPAAAGDFSTLLSLTYNDGSATQSASRTLAGQGVDGARLDDHATGRAAAATTAAARTTSEPGASPTNHTFYRLERGQQGRDAISRGSPSRAVLLDRRNVPGRGRHLQRHARGRRVVHRGGDLLGRGDGRRQVGDLVRRRRRPHLAGHPRGRRRRARRTRSSSSATATAAASIRARPTSAPSGRRRRAGSPCATTARRPRSWSTTAAAGAAAFGFTGGNYPGANGTCGDDARAGGELPGDGDVHAAGPGELRRHAGHRLRRRHRHRPRSRPAPSSARRPTSRCSRSTTGPRPTTAAATSTTSARSASPSTTCSRSRTTAPSPRR